MDLTKLPDEALSREMTRILDELRPIERELSRRNQTRRDAELLVLAAPYVQAAVEVGWDCENKQHPGHGVQLPVLHDTIEHWKKRLTMMAVGTDTHAMSVWAQNSRFKPYVINYCFWKRDQAYLARKLAEYGYQEDDANEAAKLFFKDGIDVAVKVLDDEEGYRYREELTDCIKGIMRLQ